MMANPFAHTRSAREWLAKSVELLEEGRAALKGQDQRSLLACLKAAVSFAIEARMLSRPEAWGASPIARLACFAVAESVPEHVRNGAALLQKAKPSEQDLVQLGAASPSAWLDAATQIIAHCAAECGVSFEGGTITAPTNGKTS